MAALALGLLAGATASSAAQSDVYFDVSVRGTGTATIHAAVHTNPSCARGTTLLAVHGFTETANMWQPLAEAVFADEQLGERVQRLVAIDLPAHGESSPPTGLPAGVRFGDLLVEDNASVVIQALDALRARGLGARVIIGHSMGALAVQTVQELLLAQGSSLAARGVFGAVLIAPVPAHGLPWHPPPPSSGEAQFVVNDPVLGSYFYLPPFAWPFSGGFTTFAGTLAPGTPTPAEVEANDLSGIEPLLIALQLREQTVPLPGGGSLTLQRPTVREGAFALRRGTALSVIAFSQDILTPAVDLDDLYRHLLGRNGLLYREIVADDAVHAMVISNPQGMIEALRASF
jgi:pimeloyl-ACP methyl ester carboxylesterase